MWEKFAQQTCQGTIARGCAENIRRSVGQQELEQRLQHAREQYINQLLAGVPPAVLHDGLDEVRAIEEKLMLQLSTQVANDVAMHEYVCREIAIVEAEMKSQMRSAPSDAESTLNGGSNVTKRKSRRSATQNTLQL